MGSEVTELRTDELGCAVTSFEEKRRKQHMAGRKEEGTTSSFPAGETGLSELHIILKSFPLAKSFFGLFPA